MKYETYTYIKKIQEAFVKRVIEVFQIKPEDSDTTPEYFCGVFGFCKFQTRTLNWKFSWAREAEIVVLGNKIWGTWLNTANMNSRYQFASIFIYFGKKQKCTFIKYVEQNSDVEISNFPRGENSNFLI